MPRPHMKRAAMFRVRNKKPLEVYTITEDNKMTLDWKNMSIIKRIEVGLKLIFLGEIRIHWKENRFTTSYTRRSS